jgi:hypothetical protein
MLKKKALFMEPSWRPVAYQLLCHAGHDAEPDGATPFRRVDW